MHEPLFQTPDCIVHLFSFIWFPIPQIFMAQIAKLEVQTEIKSSADKFYGFFKSNISSLVQMFPKIYESIEVLGGGDLRAGSVTCCKFDIGGGPMAAKFNVQEANDENTSMTFVILEGDILKLYKSFKAKLEAMKAGNGGSIVKWTLEFEKANENAPDPKPYADAAIKVSKGLDAHLSRT